MAERRGKRLMARGERAILALIAALAALLAFGASPGLAGLRHPNPPVASFGRDGTAATTLQLQENGLGATTTGLAIDQARHRLYAADGHRVFAFDIPNPSTHTAVTGGNFPAHLQEETHSDLLPKQIAVAEPTGNVYVQGLEGGFPEFPKFLWGIDSNGAPLPAPFPLALNSAFEFACGVTVDGAGHLWIPEHRVPFESGNPYLIKEYSQAGVPLGGAIDVTPTHAPCWLAFDHGTGDLYVSGVLDTSGSELNGLFRYTAADGFQSHNAINGFVNNAIAVDSSHHVVYVADTKFKAFNPSGGLIESFGNPESNNGDIAIDEADGAAYVVENSKIRVYEGLVTPDAVTDSASNETPTTATLNGHVEPLGAGPVTECYFEWGVNTAYTGGQVPCAQGTGFSSPEDVSAELTGLQGNHAYHYRLVAANANGRGFGEDRTASTTGKPTVESFSADGVTAESAELHARIDRHGLDTTYRFEYGTTTGYGSSAPVPDEDIGAGQGAASVSAHIGGLEATTYHFRVVAHNEAGTTVSEDQTFHFFPQSCPNAALRQQTGSEQLPDCRAYELVSPGSSGNILIRPSQITATYATNPARFAFDGVLGGINGTDPANFTGDTYVSTRTSTGWQTTRIGIPGSQLLGEEGDVGDLGLGRFIDFATAEAAYFGAPHTTSVAPYAWDVEGDFLGRWPATVGLIPNGDAFEGAFQPSPDFSHLAFSSNDVAFASGALTSAPGSAYDYDTASGTTTLVSRTAGGQQIGQEPGNSSSGGEFILFPGVRVVSEIFPDVDAVGRPAAVKPSVSTDGSHILMSTASAPYNGFGTPPLTRLYMRVNDAVTYEVSRGHDVHYLGMTAAGSKVFFTSEEKLTPADEDTSTDLYMWSEATDSLTLISKGSEGTQGNTDSCAASWTAKCDVAPIEGAAPADSSIAAHSGDVYFYSPERLLESDARPNERNVYVYRDGTLRYVATGKVTRIQVSPDGDHMAFLSPDEVTGYDNPEGFDEMFRYDPEGGGVHCLSCPGGGGQLSGDVEASLSGIFMSDDGRVFFNTPDPLVARDTDGVHDIYEFVEGRPQLITSGTSALDATAASREPAGLFGVSADGANVYFATHDTLVGQDENGQFVKFYDARTGGGFPFVPPASPCAAADECHGPGSTPPQPSTVASDQELGPGGNVVEAASPPKAGPRKKHGSHRPKRHKHVHRKRAGGAGR